jgi:hypothetical protein
MRRRHCDWLNWLAKEKRGCNIGSCLRWLYGRFLDWIHWMKLYIRSGIAFQIRKLNYGYGTIILEYLFRPFVRDVLSAICILLNTSIFINVKLSFSRSLLLFVDYSFIWLSTINHEHWIRSGEQFD